MKVWDRLLIYAMTAVVIATVLALTTAPLSAFVISCDTLGWWTLEYWVFC